MIGSRAVMILSLALVCGFAPAHADTVLINGTIVTPERVIPGGWLAIQDDKILSITQDRPAVIAAHKLVTKDIVFPGFVDLHNHPLYGIFPRWKAHVS